MVLLYYTLMTRSLEYDKVDFGQELKEASERAMERSGFEMGTLYRATLVKPCLMDEELGKVLNDPLNCVVATLRGLMKSRFGQRTLLQFRQPEPDRRPLVGRLVAMGPFSALDDGKILLTATVTARTEVKVHGGKNLETVEYAFNVHGSTNRSTPWYFKLVETDASEKRRGQDEQSDHNLSGLIAESVHESKLRHPLLGGRSRLK